MKTIEFKHTNREHLKRMYQWLDRRDWSGYSFDMSQDFQTRYYTFRNADEALKFQRRWSKQ